MLQRSTQVGEFYRMQAPKVFDTNKKLPSHYMDIVIYDEEMDKHVHIGIREALNFALGEKDGGAGQRTIADVGGDWENSVKTSDAAKSVHKTVATQYIATMKALADAATAAAVAAAAAAKGTAGEAAADTAAAAALAAAAAVPTSAALDVLPTGMNADALADEVAKGNWLPLEVIIARPFIEHLMMSAIMTVSGRDTGATLFGPAGKQPPFYCMRIRRQSAYECCNHTPRCQTCRSAPTHPSRPSRVINQGPNPATSTIGDQTTSLSLCSCSQVTTRMFLQRSNVV